MPAGKHADICKLWQRGYDMLFGWKGSRTALNGGMISHPYAKEIELGEKNNRIRGCCKRGKEKDKG